ncbi:DeoR/GlpR transcriptional regulator, partial [Salmonella enterica subsp. enterica]|nr:DeoR/GlpR transcriptional regulator [Salmonella enterica subsp. enterica]
MKAAIERRMEILEVITRQGKARVENLAERFNVSSVTIRSDLSFLEKNGY